MKKAKRVFLIVLDSLGIGNAPDAEAFGDAGSNTLRSIMQSPAFYAPHLEALGLLHIDGVGGYKENLSPQGAYGRLQEASMGKDTTIGHWEIAGIISKKPLPVYPTGFPEAVLQPFREVTGRGVLCNLPYSGTDVIRDYGDVHTETGDLIVYASADSVFQIAAHEEVVPLEQLYAYCRMARDILRDDHGVGRVIARPFVGSSGAYTRTPHRHDYSLEPPARTMMEVLVQAGYVVKGVGKIHDIFAGKGISTTVSIADNTEGMARTLEIQMEDFEGLCFVNLVDFDMVYGHRNDLDGYAKAVTEFDRQLGIFLERMGPEDVLMITADHGCDPGFPGTDHTRECVPLLMTGACVQPGVNLGTLETFSDMGATVLELFSVSGDIDGTGFWEKVRKEGV